VSNTEPTGHITGEITASPNPIPFGQRDVVISWVTNDPLGGEIRVSASAGEERLVSRGGESGHIEIPWIVDSTTYDCRLYGGSCPETPIDSVKVRRDFESVPMILRNLAEEARRGNIDVMELSQFIAAVLPRCVHSDRFREIFSFWEKSGFHVTPVHFYQPIPDTQSLPETLWSQPSRLPGIDMNDSMQLDLLRNQFSKFREEYEKFPAEPPPGQKRPFRGVDALVAYCMVRHFEPRLIIEIGSGFSSLVLGQAALKNRSSDLISIDPFPPEFLREGVPALQSLVEAKVQDLDVEFFSQLVTGDILFIDSSHTVKIGGDVNYLFLEVLPRLNPGVIVHVHDIFFPFDYRRDWVMDEFRFWTEQYLLQAFLSYNSQFEVLMANRFLSYNYRNDLETAFPSLPALEGGSFWMRRKPLGSDSNENR
jgi:predicted O-methyltransferase YrrM